jgi:hypothetical protein
LDQKHELLQFSSHFCGSFLPSTDPIESGSNTSKDDI